MPPTWNLTDIGPATLPEELRTTSDSPRERLAALVTSPRNARFGKVIVNRLWKRYLGTGLVEPVDDWDNSPSIAIPNYWPRWPMSW